MRALLLAATVAGVTPARADVALAPYVETRAVANYQSNRGREVRTWNELAAGIAADIDTKRVDLGLRYRYGQRLPLLGTVSDKGRHSGSALLRSELLRDYLYLDANANASVLNTSLGGLVNLDIDDPSQQQSYSASVQPSFRHTFANRIRASARYSYGLFEVEGGPDPFIIGQPVRLDRPFLGGASDTRNQSASAQIGNVRRSDRLRWRLSANYQRDRIEQLDQHYNSKLALADFEFGLTRSIGLLADVGYEDIHDEQDSVLVDIVTGIPILDSNGLLQRDPTNPRVVNFDVSGLTYHGGVHLSPTRRTDLLVRAGKRYGSFSANASALYIIRSDLRLTAAYNDQINNFGRLFTTLFTDPVTGTITPIASFAGGGRRTPTGTSTCAFGLDPQTGSCLFNLTQVASSATFRDRTASLTLTKGSEEFGEQDGMVQRFYGSVSGFYTHRRYLGSQDNAAPGGLVPATSLAGTTDVSYGVTGMGQRLLGANRYITFDLRAQRNEYGLSRGGKDVLASGRVRYEMLLDRNINVFAIGFVANRWVDERANLLPVPSRFDVAQRTDASFTIGLRYLFSPYRGRFTPFEHAANRPEG